VADPLRETFDRVAERYVAARPVYPDALYDDLVELAELEPGARLLEVGCGPGIATRPLLRRGYRITCVELGERLASEARRNLAGLPVEIHVGSFESWPGEPGGFDLVYAATAWHWVEPETRYRLAHAQLRPGGRLAFWAASHAFPADADPIFRELQPVYEELGEARVESWPLPEDVPDDAAEIEASGLFEDVRVRRHVWARRYTADEYIALLDTFSGHIAMGAIKRARLYGEIRRRVAERPDGTLRRHWLAILHVARRREAD
jgi:SAM-dependent methyltransferase